ncbi:hypothetical protein QUF63_02505 [Anaerolineales bacterium HSG25]|nr:hypothetical protein [Anaerolineales bacterium HSG25]
MIYHLWPKFGPPIVVLLLSTLFVITILTIHHGDPMSFVRLGTRYGQGDPNGTIGYDGQFAYQIAIAPFEAAAFMDIPAYRYQRILYPISARLAGLGQPQFIVWSLIGLNIMALTIGTYLIGLILTHHHLSRWYSLTVGLFAGQLVSLRLDLNEPFALTFAIGAVYAFEMKRPRIGALCLALSMLSKETAIAFIGGYLLYFFLRRQWRLCLETGLISLTPFAMLQLVLWLTLGQIGLRSGGQGATSFSIIPFGGLLGFDLAEPATLITVLLILGPIVILPSLTLSFHVIQYLRAGKHHPMVWVLVLHLLMMITLPFSTYADLPGMLRLMSGLVVTTVLFGTVTRSRKLLNYSLLWLLAGPLLIFLV